jgi:hypothetical protein
MIQINIYLVEFSLHVIKGHAQKWSLLGRIRARSLAIKVTGRKERENLTHINFTYLHLLLEMH